MPLEIVPQPRRSSNLYQFDVEAQGLGRYTIDVSLPAEQKPGEKFPVILVTDGNMHFDTVQGYVHGGAGTFGLALPPSIVVGVGYPADEGRASHYGRRNIDFYGEWDMADEVGQIFQSVYNGMRKAEGKPEEQMKAGGAFRFTEFLGDALLPALARHFPIDLKGRHTLIGHSSGGCYVLHALFNPKSPFSRYIAISGGFGPAPGTIEKLEAEYAAAHDDMDADVFLCCGREEIDSMRVWGLCRVGSTVIRVAEQFAVREWKSARVVWEIMNNEDHGSVLQRAIAAGLRSVHRKRPGFDEGAHLPFDTESTTYKLAADNVGDS